MGMRNIYFPFLTKWCYFTKLTLFLIVCFVYTQLKRYTPGCKTLFRHIIHLKHLHIITSPVPWPGELIPWQSISVRYSWGTASSVFCFKRLLLMNNCMNCFQIWYETSLGQRACFKNNRIRCKHWGQKRQDPIGKHLFAPVIYYTWLTSWIETKHLVWSITWARQSSL